MKATLPRSIGPINMTKVAKKVEKEPHDYSTTASLFAYYKLENFLCLLAPFGKAFTIADSEDTEGFSYCNKADSLKFLDSSYHDSDLVNGVLMIANFKKDIRVERYGELNPVVAIGKILSEYKCEGIQLVFQHLRWKHTGDEWNNALPHDVAFGFALGDRPFDLFLSDDFESFTIRDRNNCEVAEGKLSGVGMKSTVAVAIEKLRKELDAADIKIEDII